MKIAKKSLKSVIYKFYVFKKVFFEMDLSVFRKSFLKVKKL